MEDKDNVMTEIRNPDILWYMKNGEFHVGFLGKSLPFAEIDKDDFEDGLARMLNILRILKSQSRSFPARCLTLFVE